MAEIFCDVLVIGGGAAGVAAAVAAGRAGARVVLLERYGFLGGLASAAQVGTVCGLFLRDTAGSEPIPVGGFGQEFGLRLQKASNTQPLRLNSELWVLPYRQDAFTRVADAMICESGNITLIHHATVTGVQVQGCRLTAVDALAWSEPLRFTPAAVVDCTGEATASILGGANVECGAADQSPALVFALDNVVMDLEPFGLLEVRRAIRPAVEAGRLPAAAERLSLVPGGSQNGRLTLKLNLLSTRSERPLWQQVTHWERESRALADAICRFLIETVASFRHARVGFVASQIGVRSGHRIVGKSRLRAEDVLSARKTPLGIARGSWPMERWSPSSPRPEMTYFSERDYYEIPLDCLRPAELDNVLAAGRCICACPAAMTSARVIGTALGTGWAAGTAAAFQVSGRSMEEAVATIRKQMTH